MVMVSLAERRRKAGKPLQIKLDPVTEKVVGDESTAFVRLLGTQTSILCPGHHLDFADVPDHYKEQVLDRMKVLYIDPHISINSCYLF